MTSRANSNDQLMIEQCYAGKLPSIGAISTCYFNTIQLNIIAHQVCSPAANTTAKRFYYYSSCCSCCFDFIKSLLSNTNKFRNTKLPLWSVSVSNPEVPKTTTPIRRYVRLLPKVSHSEASLLDATQSNTLDLKWQGVFLLFPLLATHF